MKPECVVEIGSILGESPLWSPKENKLYWVDIHDKKVHCYDPNSGENVTRNVPESITSIAHREQGGFIVTTRKHFAFFDFASGQLTKITEVEPDLKHQRFNDGQCDRFGRFWAGTMNEDQVESPSGALYCIDSSHNYRCLHENVALSNGIGWSPDNATMYFVETFRHAIFAFDFDLERGTLSNRRTFAEISKASGGLIDGLTVDQEGGVWCAQPGLSRIARYDADGKEDLTIALPVTHPTSCTFGGKEMDTLYVTTARELLSDEEVKKYPLSGSLFAIKTPFKGIAETPFRG